MSRSASDGSVFRNQFEQVVCCRQVMPPMFIISPFQHSGSAAIDGPNADTAGIVSHEMSAFHKESFRVQRKLPLSVGVPNDRMVRQTAGSASEDGISPPSHWKRQVSPVRSASTAHVPAEANAGVDVSAQSPVRSQSSPPLECSHVSNHPSAPHAADGVTLSRVEK